MDREKFKLLAAKISSGKASQKEIALYSYYYDMFQEAKEWDESELGKESEIERELHRRIRKEVFGFNHYFVRFPYLKIAVAVMVLAVGSMCFFLLNQRSSVDHTISSIKKIPEIEIEPGTTKATLVLSDGRMLDLDASQNGILASQGNVLVEKNEDGQVTYSSKSDKRISEVTFNTIKIPKGGRYQLTLPDGTKVWLNSVSSLRFPVTFSEESRIVELDGEAYFEVSKQSKQSNSQRKPFVVKTFSQEITVLGTQFNVNAYKDEEIAKTTLIEGKVKISSTSSDESKTLSPGEQACFLHGGNIRVIDNVDVEEAIAWKKGIFYFNNTDLSVIMRQLARWYDVDIDTRSIPQKKFNGELSRDVKLSQVLQMMEKTSGLKFKVEGRRVSMLK